MSDKQTEVYIKAEQATIVQKQRILLSDAVKIVTTDKKIEQELNNIPIAFVSEKKRKKIVFSVMEIVSLMVKACPEISVNILGEDDFIIEYVPKKKQKKWLEYSKAFFVCLTVFFGGAFAIMTFNEDANVQDIFMRLYGIVTGSETSTGVLELAYSIGIPLGIILFFDHFSKVKIDSDPTPLQVELRLYEKDVNEAIIENAGKEGKKKDVS